ncbi:MAG: hypothetical protein AAB518_03510 [Patescibacteria group bacterium]
MIQDSKGFGVLMLVLGAVVLFFVVGGSYVEGVANYHGHPIEASAVLKVGAIYRFHAIDGQLYEVPVESLGMYIIEEALSEKGKTGGPRFVWFREQPLPGEGTSVFRVIADGDTYAFQPIQIP